MLGEAVWPQDFEGPRGQKVFLAWWVPACNDVCPYHFLSDNVCDLNCNTSLCEYDGCKFVSFKFFSYLVALFF